MHSTHAPGQTRRVVNHSYHTPHHTTPHTPGVWFKADLVLASFPHPSGWPAMAERAVRSAARRRERWLRSMWRHEQLSVRLAVATATHHSWKSHAVVGTQTEYVAPACTSATVTTGVNLDVSGLVSPLFSRTAVEGSASQVVDPLPPAEEFSEPVCNQVHRERFAAGETVENLVDIPVVQEQVIVQAFPRVVGSHPPVAESAGPVYDPVYLEQFSAGETTENTAKIPVVQEQVIVQATPRVVDSLPPVSEFTGPVYDQVHQVQFTAGEVTENFAKIPVVHEQVIAQDIPEVVDSLPGPVYDQVHQEIVASSEMAENFAEIPVVHE